MAGRFVTIEYHNGIDSNIQPGDVLYGPGHVGLYVGGGMMVHAATPAQGIVYAPMYDGYRVYKRIID